MTWPLTQTINGNTTNVTTTPAQPVPPVLPTGQNMQQMMASQVNNPSLPPGTQMVPTLQTVNPDELMTTQGLQGTVAGIPGAAENGIAGHNGAGEAAITQDPYATAAAQYQATTIGNQNAPTGTAAQGTLSEGGTVEAAQGTMDPNALVRTQYEQLMNFGEGEVPLWAQGAVREANARMNDRGLANSSMTAGEVTGALAEAAKPIAMADAQAYFNLMMQNLNNRQQAAVENAKNFLTMDMANLNNRQQMALTNLNNRLQVMLSDQAAENASKQFNATSQQQNDQFFASLVAQINEQNATRVDAMRQFNSAELNKINALNAQMETDVNKLNAEMQTAMNKFNAELESNRQMFNVQNQQIIDQANVTWRRAINTNNTAAINASNETNVQNMFNLSATAQAALWQQWRDEASWAFTSGENALNRAHNLAIAAMQRSTAFNLMDKAQQEELYELMGVFASNLLGELF